MPLPVPNLDDRTFDQLATEARALIPRNFPAWTDHNPSDPGITLLELFAFLLEAAIYQLNRVPERSLEHFAKLVGVTRGPGESIEQTLRRAIEALEERSRAITTGDIEFLVTKGVFSSQPALQQAIARAKAVVEVVDTPNVFPDEQFVKVVIVPNEPDTPAPLPTDELRQAVFEFLHTRRLITTRVQVIAPEYTAVRIAVTVVRDFSTRFVQNVVQQNVERAVRNFLSPLIGGVDRRGWEFGRPVFRSELYQVIEGVAGVDHVGRLLLNGDETGGELRLASPMSLVRLGLDELIVTVVDA